MEQRKEILELIKKLSEITKIKIADILKFVDKNIKED